MYSRQQAAQLKTKFWTAFGLYMKPVPTANSEKVNWINYKTGEKHINFKMEATHTQASVGIRVSHPDINLQHLYFEQLRQLKPLLQNYLQEEWEWGEATATGEGLIMSVIEKQLLKVNVFNKEDWPALISFFKPRIIALDSFWSDVRYAFEALH